VGFDSDQQGRQAQEGCSFLKKRAKKRLTFGLVLPKHRATAEKSFLLLFFKKEALAFFRRSHR
jgi:hypothetical protein